MTLARAPSGSIKLIHHPAEGGMQIVVENAICESPALGKCRIRVHHLRMSNDARLIVHFSCPSCATVYTTRQEEQPGRHPGDFHCRMCGTPVHEWTGLYNFTDWQLTILRRKRTGQRV